MSSLVLFSSICLMWGSSFILMKFAVLSFSPASVAVWRIILGGLFLLVVWKIKKVKMMERKYLLPLFMVALVGLCLPFYLQPWLIEKTKSSAMVGMMIAFVPLFTIVASIPILKITPTRRELMGVMGSLVCLMVMCWDGLQREISWVDLALASLVPLLYATTNAYIKRKFSSVDPLVLSCLELLMISAIAFPIVFTEGAVVMNEHFLKALFSLVILGVFSTGLAGYIFFTLIQRHGPLYTGLINYIIPFVALGWGWYFGENLSVLQVVSLVGVLAMIYITQSGQGKAKLKPS